MRMDNACLGEGEEKARNRGMQETFILHCNFELLALLPALYPWKAVEGPFTDLTVWNKISNCFLCSIIQTHTGHTQQGPVTQPKLCWCNPWVAIPWENWEPAEMGCSPVGLGISVNSRALRSEHHQTPFPVILQMIPFTTFPTAKTSDFHFCLRLTKVPKANSGSWLWLRNHSYQEGSRGGKSIAMITSVKKLLPWLWKQWKPESSHYLPYVGNIFCPG